MESVKHDHNKSENLIDHPWNWWIKNWLKDGATVWFKFKNGPWVNIIDASFGINISLLMNTPIFISSFFSWVPIDNSHF